MATTAITYGLYAFFAFFGYVVGYSSHQRQAGEKVAEAIKQETISNKIIPNVKDVYERVTSAYSEEEISPKGKTLAYGEEESLLKDELTSKLDEGLLIVARAMKYLELIKQLGRFMFWFGVAGLGLELIFIVLVILLGEHIVLSTVAIGTSFLLFFLCGIFWSIRERNLQKLEDLRKEVI